MSTTSDPDPSPMDATTQEWLDIIDTYYDDAIKELAQHYPQEQAGLAVDWRDVAQANTDLADEFLEKPATILPYAEEALRHYDLPVDIDLSNAAVRVHNLLDEHTYYPGEFSPTDHNGHYVSIRGEVVKATSTYARIQEAAFECQRCGAMTRVRQSGGDLHEPHECPGCERQGPFQTDYNQSDFIDAQDLLVKTPPDQDAGEGDELEVHVERDLTDTASVGDRVTISGIAQLEQSGDETTRYDITLEGHHIALEQTDHTDVDVTSDERERIFALADGAEGDPLEVAAESYYPDIYGYETIKQALVLAIVAGATDTPEIRGEFHVLLLGDPSTAKSQLVERIDKFAVRAIAASANDTTGAGLTTTASRDEFGDGGEWTLEAGAFVKANEGVLYIDELDDMDPADRKSMLDPMSKQKIHVSKAGINATLSTQTTVVAAANPTHGRWDYYEPLQDQFGFDANLQSRFDLIFTIKDKPDSDDDAAVAEHMMTARDARKRRQRDEDLDAEQRDAIEGPVDEDILRKWLALAKRQPDPVYASEDVREDLQESFVTLRGMHGYDETDTVPVTFRKLPAVERIAEACAKLEFSETIEQRHALAAMEIVGQSMQDYAQNEEGELDADIQETGESHTRREKKKHIAATINELEDDYDNGVPVEEVVDAVDYDADEVEYIIEKAKHEDGEAIEPQSGHVRWLGRQY